MATEQNSRRNFLRCSVVAAAALGSPVALSGHDEAGGISDNTDDHDVAVASIWRPARGVQINVVSVSFDPEYPAAHELQQELDRGGLSRASWMSPGECSLPVPEDQCPQRITLTFFEGEDPGIDLALDGPQLEGPSEDGGLVVRGESHGFQIAGGTALARRWLTLGLSYQHWVTRALLGPLLTDFPHDIDREDIGSVLSAGWRASDSKTSSRKISLSQIALAPLDERRPDAAIWRAWDEIQEGAQAYLSGPPVAYLLTVHASRNPIATMHRESGALRALVDPGIPLLTGLDDLGGSDISPFVTILGVLDLDRFYDDRL